MKRLVLILVTSLVLVVGGTALADSPPEPEFLMNVVQVDGVSSSFLHYNGSLTAPAQLNFCERLTVDPGYNCGVMDADWNDNILLLPVEIYFIGAGLTSYSTTASAEEFGWSVTASSDGFAWEAPEEPVEHVFRLGMNSDGEWIYVYEGNDPDDFPRPINYCSTLPADPWWLCGTLTSTVWVLYEDGWTHLVPASWYFVGSGMATYLIDDTMADLGWSLTPNGDGFSWEEPDVTIEHTFMLALEPLLYIYNGNDPDGFPRGINQCRSLEVAPWFECGYTPDPAWSENAQGLWTLQLEEGTTFVGSGGAPIVYEGNPELERNGWSVSPNADGFVYNAPTYKLFIPLVIR